MIDNYKEIILEYSKSGAFYSSETQPYGAMMLSKGWYVWDGRFCYGPFRTEQEAVDYVKEPESNSNECI